MRKGIWIGMLLFVAVGLLAKEPATKPAKQTEPTSQPASVYVELREKALDAGFKPLVEKRRGGGIDWTEAVVFAKGEGKATGDSAQAIALAKQAARTVAMRNAALLTAGIRVDAKGRFLDIKDEQIASHVFVKDAKVLSEVYDPPSRTATVRVEVPLYGVNGLVKTTKAAFKPVRGRAWDWPGEGLGGSTDVVIIDARGIQFAPCVAPCILTDSGESVFGPADVPAGEIHKRGMVLYVFMKDTGVRRDAKSVVVGPLARAKVVTAQAGRIDPEFRAMAQKAFERPLLLVADNTLETSRGTIVLTSAAVKELAICGEARKLMKAGKIIIVTDTTRVESRRRGKAEE